MIRPGFIRQVTLFILTLILFPIWLNAQFCLPLQSLKLTSGYGWRNHPVTGTADFHHGIDLSARFEPIYAITISRVSAIGNHPILGNFIRIESEGLEITYGHLSKCLVKTGEEVDSGQILGFSGDSGRVTGPHLHLSIKFRGSYVHPLRLLQGMIDSNNCF